MENTDRSALPSKWPLSLQYFFYFGVMGVVLPYFSLYCYHLGFTGPQIGAMGGLRTMTIVVFALFWGILADRFDNRKPVYVFCNIFSALMCSAFLYYETFWPLFIFTFLYSMFYGPLIAFLEAFTMDALGVKGSDKREYGKVRVWGSVSFITMVIGIGWAMDVFSIRVVAIAVVSGSILQAIFAPLVPAGKGREQIKLSAEQMKAFFTPRMNVFLFCAFLMLVSHGTYYGFFSIHLEKVGYSKLFIGLSWGLASLLEIIVMLNSKLVFKHFSLRSVLIFSFAAAALRWIMLFFFTSPVMILLSQTLHAITYGAFHVSCILYMDEHSKETKTFGQVINFAVSYGLGFAVGMVINGHYFEKLGSDMYLASCLIAICGGIIMAINEKKPAAVKASQ